MIVSSRKFAAERQTVGMLGELLDNSRRQIAAEGVTDLAALGLGAEEQDGRGAQVDQYPDQRREDRVDQQAVSVIGVPRRVSKWHLTAASAHIGFRLYRIPTAHTQAVLWEVAPGGLQLAARTVNLEPSRGPAEPEPIRSYCSIGLSGVAL